MGPGRRITVDRVMNEGPGDDMTITPWVVEHGKHLPPVLVAECSAPDAGLFGLVLPRAGWTYPARVGVRPATAPGWLAAFRLDPPELTITQPNGAQFFVGALPDLPERWAYAAGELGWCVVYLVLGELPEVGDPVGNLSAIRTAALAGRVFAARMPIERT
jgi:hypothetical protein